MISTYQFFAQDKDISLLNHFDFLEEKKMGNVEIHNFILLSRFLLCVVLPWNFFKKINILILSP